MANDEYSWNGAVKPKEPTEGVVTGLVVGVGRTDPPKPKAKASLPTLKQEEALLKVEKIGARKRHEIRPSGRAKLRRS